MKSRWQKQRAYDASIPVACVGYRIDHHWLSIDNQWWSLYHSHRGLDIGMARKRHAKSEVESALRYAESKGWRVEVGGSHAWGKMYCPYNDGTCRCGEFCIASIWSTPKNPGNHARQLRRVLDNCAIAQQKDEAAQRED